MVKRLVVSTLQLQRQEVSEESMGLLEKEREECRERVLGLREERKGLRRRIDGQGGEECGWMGKLKAANL